MKLPTLLEGFLANLIKTIGLLVGIFVLIFFLMRILPGDIVDLMAIDGGLDENMKAELRTELGIDKSLPEQFFIWCRQMLRFDFGKSLRFGKPVTEIIGYSLPVTLRLALISCAVGLGLGMALAFLAVWKKSKFFATLIEAINVWSIAVPTFCAGFMLIFMFVLGMRIMPLSGNFLLPVAVLAVDIAGQVAKPLFEEMKDTLSARFVTIARSKGMDYRRIVIRHVIPNSATVLIALSGLIVAGALGGSITLEVLFNLPGLGQLAFNAVSGRDYPIIQALAIFIASITILVNFVTDSVALLIDPRQRDILRNT
ncbi:MAG TPA: ABC transporter permease [Spirochaetaceae bacterium]|nr:ABC transporter permease [Spirochaetaceae bacterium]